MDRTDALFALHDELEADSKAELVRHCEKQERLAAEADLDDVGADGWTPVHCFGKRSRRFCLIARRF